MKIAFLSTFYPYCGNIAAGNTALYRILSEQHNVSLYNFSLLYPEMLFPNIKQFVSEKEIFDVVNSQRILNSANPASYYSTAKTIKNFEPDVLLTRCWMPYLALSLGSVAGFLEVKNSNNYINNYIFERFTAEHSNENKRIYRIAIIDDFGTELKQFRQEKNNKLYIENHDAFVTFSAKITKQLLEISPGAIYAEHPQPFFSFSNSNIEKSQAQKILNVPAGKKVLLFLGEIREYKGVDILLELIGKLDDSYYLLLAGNSITGFDYYQKIIKKLKIEHKIGLNIRHLDTNEIPIFYTAADVIVMPTRKPIERDFAIESLSYNLPIITSTAAEVPDMIEQQNLGIVLQNLELESLADAVTNYFANNLRELFVKNKVAYESVASWESLAATIYNLLDKIF